MKPLRFGASPEKREALVGPSGRSAKETLAPGTRCFFFLGARRPSSGYRCSSWLAAWFELFRSASASYFVPGRTGHESSAFGPRVLSTIRRPINHSPSDRTLHRARQRGPSPGLKVSRRGSLGTSSSREPLGHVGALGLRPHNYALQRTRVPSSRFLRLHGSPLNAISLAA